MTKELLTKYIENANKIVVFSGAGISTLSNIKDFKTLDEEMKENKIKFNREKLININFFNQDAEMFWSYFNDIFDMNLITQAKPNKVHSYFAELENVKDISIITQNIDKLHQKAGNKNVLEIHGTSDSYICPKCHKIYDQNYVNQFYDLTIENNQIVHAELKLDTVPICKFDNEILKPNVVLYNEDIKHFEEAKKLVKEAELFIVIGTGLNVFPINSLVEYYAKLQIKNRRYNFSQDNRKMILLNQSKTPYDNLFDYIFREDFDILF